MGQVHDLITKDMTISEVIEKYPSTIETLLMTGVHCIGCHVSYFETLEQGMKGHGMTDEEIDDVIKEMNNVVKEEKLSNNEDFKITEKAASKIKEVIKDKDGLRIEVIPGGCSGYMYNITTEDKINNDDKVFEEKGVKVILDKESLDLLKGSKLDYVDSLQDAGFRIHNPNAKSTCGCGHSFG
ncbi:MAG: Iron-sulfur cluster assembly accessory protein [archaeon GW2011_AR20]|nr:MAG: Iron-sulfur cluster assembly accessory protein [archaeon GW2011_AR20]MBS3160957.1 iron-sulfur cluster assembly accessory protein [Candidatus Woesearchaeota archaeon]